MISSPEHHYLVDRLAIEVHATPAALGRAAARAALASLHEAIARQGEARVIFACAPSQDEFLAALVRPELSGAALDWSRVTAFHMDDYIGLQGDHPQSFRAYLRSHLLSRVKVGRFYPLEAEDADSPAVCARYAHLLRAAPIDLICMGVGENGHIAFNDPPVADFNDPLDVKVVLLDDQCRQQQVDDECFARFDDVPEQAITLTVPRLMRATKLFCVVPGRLKQDAVRATLYGPISTQCPASILREHADCSLYLDAESNPDA